jgi:hypothetical protein
MVYANIPGGDIKEIYRRRISLQIVGCAIMLLLTANSKTSLSPCYSPASPRPFILASFGWEAWKACRTSKKNPGPLVAMAGHGTHLWVAFNPMQRLGADAKLNEKEEE